MHKQNRIERNGMESKRIESKRVVEYEVIIVIDDEWNGTEKKERESSRRLPKIMAHRGLGHVREIER
jgi:hypothetical protein